jgi:two-component sensor histidine kinase
MEQRSCVKSMSLHDSLPGRSQKRKWRSDGAPLMTQQLLPEGALLMRELTHRINNEFTSAISMVSLAAARADNDNARDVLAAVADRLEEYARVHRALQMPEHGTHIDASAWIRELCRSISRSRLVGRNIELVFVDCPLRMDSGRCWLLGMIICELITNASRHAFDDKGGQIRVETLLTGRFVKCRVSDTGAPLRDVRPGRGRKIIDALTKRLDGTFDQQFGPHGSISTLVFPFLET